MSNKNHSISPRGRVMTAEDREKVKKSIQSLKREDFIEAIKAANTAYARTQEEFRSFPILVI